MSDPIFPPEILDLFMDELGSAIDDPQSRAALLTCALVNRQFYHRANSYIFSSLSISTRRSRKCLIGLVDIINANPDIVRHIRSLTMQARSYTESLPDFIRQLCHLQKFEWISVYPDEWPQSAPITASIGNICHLPSLTALHLERIRDFPLSIFSACCRLESLTLIMVRFARIGPKALSAPLLSSLKRLVITGPLWSNEEVYAIGIIMTRAAPTLTSLILYNTRLNDPKPLDLNSTVFPLLESITISSTIFPEIDNHTVPIFISRFLDCSAPMVSQIQIKFILEGLPYIMAPGPQLFMFDISKGWSPIDKILSSSKYPALDTLDLTFSEKFPPHSSELDTVLPFLNKILPGLSSRGQIKMKIRDASSEPQLNHSCIQIHFVF